MYTDKPLENWQIRKMYGLAKKLCLTDDGLHDVVKLKTKKDSIRDLTSYQANLVASHLEMLLGEEPKTPWNRPTNAQQAKIYVLVRELGWLDDPKRLRGFLEKRYGVSDVRFLTDKKTNDCIEGLKAILKGGRAERSGYAGK